MRRLAYGCGIAAGPLFVLSFLVQGAVRDGYDPRRHPVSSLALGPHGWVQTLTFLVAGVLCGVLAAGLWRTPGAGRWGPLMLGTWGAGLVGAGLFTTDPVSGYPAGTPDLLTTYGSTHAALHDGLSLLGFVGLFAACLVFARRFAARRRWGWAAYSAATAVVFAVFLGLASAAFAQSPGLVENGGLFQRVMIVAAWSWVTLLTWRVIGRKQA